MLALPLLLVLAADVAPPKPAPAPAAAAKAETPKQAVGADGVLDFTEEAKLLFRVVACEGDAPLPKNIDEKVLVEHCKELHRRMDLYRKTWVGVAEPFLQKLKPAGLPTTVVYPFGGGDLISALTTWPEATEITTMSLEYAGDPRRIYTVDSKTLKGSLALIRSTSSGLLVANDSKTENLMKGQRGDLPGQLSFFLIALAVHGYEPISLRYVRIEPDGSVRGVTQKDVDDLMKKEAPLLKSGWTSPDFSEAFANIELKFQKKGDPKDTKVHRHFAANLDDDHFGKDEGMKKHLEAKGRIVAMTKAASYLLWRPNFSTIRDYLLAHMEFMFSDSTGVPHSIALEKGFEQNTFGKFDESFLAGNPTYNADFKKLWAKAEPLPFRYGYLDKKLQMHMLVTKKAAAKKE
jgi:hypothetical protein